MASPKHRPGYIIALTLALLFYAVSLLFNYFATTSFAPLFYNNTGSISDKFYLDITPSGATFSIWGVIYLWQCVWLAYAFSCLCRRGIDGYLYYSPDFLPVWVYVAFIFTSCLNASWLIVWDRELLIVAVIVLAVTVASLYVALVVSHRALARNEQLLRAYGMAKELWLTRFMVHNGLAFYATWTSIATLLNLASAITYAGDLVPQEVSSTISLGILSAELVVYFALDMSVWDRFVRYTFSPYIVLIWALTGAVIDDGADLAKTRNSIFTVVLLAIAATMFLVKVAVMIYRHCKKPFQNQPNTQGLNTVNVK